MLQIRDLVLLDALSAAELHARTWQETYTGIFPAEVLASRTTDKLLPVWTKMLGENPAGLHHLGAFRDGELAGHCSLGKPREAWGYDVELWAMNVPKSFQKQGVGRALFEEARRRFQQMGAKNFYLYCLERNENALAFYLRMGGRITDRYDDSDGARELAVVWDSL
jgi:GNAT superfamily N-acetyltransferase